MIASAVRAATPLTHALLRVGGIELHDTAAFLAILAVLALLAGLAGRH